ncbi:MAG: ABC transporter permease [Alicyclobacillus sp.]|nr:ABC transporter permease [Alicyclobacillus sp.]
MLAYIVRRLGGAIVVLIGISMVTFLITFAVPGDPARMIVGPHASMQVVEQVRHNLGLDKPLYIQYLNYMGRLLHGNLGYSYNDNLPVWTLIRQRMGNTAQLAFGGWIVELAIGIPFGLISALRHQKLSDYVVSFLATFGFSLPAFWLGMELIYNVAYKLHWFPIGGTGGIRHLVLPAVTLGIVGAAFYQRLIKASMLEVFDQDYIRTARANGVPPFRVTFHHAFRNGIIPAVTYAGMDISLLLGGVVLIEQVFNYPGVGELAYMSINNLDVPVIMATVLLAAVFVVVANFVVDILYAFIDPRITLS